MDIKDIEKLADLAKIELTDTEKQGLLKDLDSILGYVKQIESVEVEDLKLEYPNRNIWREDLPRQRRGEDESIPAMDGASFSRDLIIGQFPDSQDGFVKVKKIL